MERLGHPSLFAGLSLHSEDLGCQGLWEREERRKRRSAKGGSVERDEEGMSADSLPWQGNPLNAIPSVVFDMMSLTHLNVRKVKKS